MPSQSLATIMKTEIQRLARKEVKAQMSSTRKATVQYRKDIARLKRQVSDLERQVTLLEKSETRRLRTPAPISKADGARFSARSVKAQRSRLGLSAADFGKLVGVSSLTIYNWEHGKSRPRKQALAALVGVRKLGKREAAHRLEKL